MNVPITKVASHLTLSTPLKVDNVTPTWTQGQYGLFPGSAVENRGPRMSLAGEICVERFPVRLPGLCAVSRPGLFPTAVADSCVCAVSSHL